MAVFTGGGATVRMDPAPVVFAKVFYTGSQPDRFLRRRTELVAAAARANAPIKTGRLKASIHVNQNRDQRGRFGFGFSVEASASYAGYVHGGTGPSVRTVYPHKMKFKGTNGFKGKYVLSHVVNHPGTPAQPFLQNALPALGA